MKLFISQLSPFARKCRILVRERGLLSQVEEIATTPATSEALIGHLNPILQVPTFVDASGAAWADSPLICQYLDTLGEGPRFIPEGAARWDALRREVGADGIMEMGVKIRSEVVRPAEEQSVAWIERWRTRIVRGLDAAERAAPPSAALDIGAVAAICAVSYIGFRIPDIDWRAGRPKLAALHEALEDRPSFRDTAPV